MVCTIIVYVHTRRGAALTTAPVVPGFSRSAPSPRRIKRPSPVLQQLHHELFTGETSLPDDRPQNPSPELFSLMDGDNDTPPIGVLQNDMATFLPGKRKTGLFEHFYGFFSSDRT